MTKQEKFLNLYKDYETMVRNAGQDTKTLEDTMGEVRGGRMRQCRLFRNYMSHTNDSGFLIPSDTMIAFLESEVLDWKMRGDVAKKHLKSVAQSICSPKDKCSDVLAKMSKLKTDVLVVSDNGFYTVSLWDVLNLFLASKSRATVSIKDVKSGAKKVSVVAPTVPISDIDKNVVTVCTSDGTADGKLLGTVWFK